MFEYAGNAHMHTPYSDGTKWHAQIAEDAISAGLDFIIVTDHNIWVDGLEGYYENEQGKVLVLVGEEVHDMRRQPQANHFLAYGAEKELSPFAQEPQILIDETVAAGGFGFLAHPFDPDVPQFGEPSLGWRTWSLEGYAGLEIWNYMSNFKGHLGSRLKTMVVALYPERFITGPEPETLRRWDELLSMGNRVSAIGNSDAHGLNYKMGPVSRIIYPYTYLFSAVNTHIVSKNPLSGVLSSDKKIVLDSLRQGRGWVGYDLPYPTKGFRFSGQAVSKGTMGSEIKFGIGATLQVLAPRKCNIRLIHNGEVVAEAADDISITHLPTEPGAYRAECFIKFRGKFRGWIYSNPIYLL